MRRMSVLPPCPPGGSAPGQLAAWIQAWATSPAMAELTGYFGGSVPDGPVAAVLDGLAGFSAVWDFRGGVRERFDKPDVDYAPELDARLRSLVDTLGLAGADGPEHDGYDHVVVLGGGVRVAMGRTEYAARLLAGGVHVKQLAGLGSLRWRDDREHREGLRLGLEAFDTEADMMLVGLRRALELGEPKTVRAESGWWHRMWDTAGLRAWPQLDEVHVLAAASTRPGLRANTADTLLGWAEQVHRPGPGERVLLVTNDPYVLHQHCDAVRLLGLRYGCGIETVGFDAAATLAWGRPLRTAELLQEVRSSVLAMRNLYTAVSTGR